MDSKNYACRWIIVDCGKQHWLDVVLKIYYLIVNRSECGWFRGKIRASSNKDSLCVPHNFSFLH